MKPEDKKGYGLNQKKPPKGGFKKASISRELIPDPLCNEQVGVPGASVISV
jgi:hypothetical protein